MRVKLEGITVLAHDVPRLASFYRDVLGFKRSLFFSRRA